MKIVGIAAKDWASAGFNVFQALQRYGMDARFICLYPHGRFTAKYDVMAWQDGPKAASLIADADIYFIFESGGTISFLNKLKLKDRPRVLIVNSSSYYTAPSKLEALRPYGNVLVGLTANYPVDDIILGNQPVDERIFKCRGNYGLINNTICAGAAPFAESHKKKKGLKIIEKHMSLHYIMGESHNRALSRISSECDIFTHGIYYAYGYTIIEAAMMGIPCFGSILDRDKKHLLLDGEYPIYDIGRQGERIPEMLEFFSDESNRKEAGEKMRRWAIKYHSQKACYETYKKIFEGII